MTFVIATLAGLAFLHVFAGLWRSISMRNLVDVVQDIANLRREQNALMRHQLWNGGDRGDRLEEEVKREFLRSRQKEHQT